MQGHRGARGLAPENTLAAFERALELGVDTLELDVGISRDDVAIVVPDRRLDPGVVGDAQGRRAAPRPPGRRLAGAAPASPARGEMQGSAGGPLTWGPSL
ncbi:MAG TPA: glycerophosphodiester phosphodiesterase family protein, partial [Burkholderiaceae bacterium]|nr:glycerophosphodiester phosphodiesterase family protein [Burkholderiaceae bacterium]